MTTPNDYRDWYEEPGAKCPECDELLEVEHCPAVDSPGMYEVRCKACGQVLHDYYVESDDPDAE